MRRVLQHVFFLAVLFPYLSFFDVPFDTQPWALVMAFAIVMISFSRSGFALKKQAWLFLFVSLYATSYFLVLVLFETPSMLDGLRSLTWYFSILFISSATALIYETIDVKLFQLAVFVWTLVAGVQTFVSKSFASVLLPRLSTSLLRGVTSLAAEPSHFARMAVLMLSLNEIFFFDHKYSLSAYSLIFLLLSVCVLLSLSGVGFVLYFFFIFTKLLLSIINTRNGIRRLCLLAIMVLAPFAFFFLYNLPFVYYNRAGILFRSLFVGDYEFILSQGGFVSRVSSSISSIEGFFRSGLIGFGPGRSISYESGIQLLSILGRDVITGKIQGGLLFPLFELGFVGLILLIVLFIVFFRKPLHIVDEGLRLSTLLASTNVVFSMLIWGNLSLPLFGFFVGVCMSLGQRHEPRIILNTRS